MMGAEAPGDLPVGSAFPNSCQAGPRKIFRFFRNANQVYVSRRPALSGGAYRDRHGRGAGCDGRDGFTGRVTPLADGEAVWSWHPDAGVKSLGDDPEGDGGYQARHTEESAE